MVPRLKHWSRGAVAGLALGVGAAIWFQQTGFSTLVELRDSLDQERALAAEVEQLEAQNTALDAEIHVIRALGADFRMGTRCLRLDRSIPQGRAGRGAP